MKTVFIMGTGRCGTTLIADYLNKNETVINMHETHLFHEFDKFVGIVRRRLIKGLINQGYRVSEKYCGRAIERMLIYPARSFLNEFSVDLCKRFDKRIIIDKTPHNLEIVKMLDLIYQEPHFIHVVRNPLDVYASMKVHSKWGFTEVYSFIKWYSKFMHTSLNQWKELEETEIVIVFEKFIHDPQKYMDQICIWLGIPRILIKYLNPKKAHINRYKNDLSPKEIGLIKDKCMKFYDKWEELS